MFYKGWKTDIGFQPFVLSRSTVKNAAKRGFLTSLEILASRFDENLLASAS
ncbi:hypothetical protein [Polaromonas sp. SM01]|uniref:hypothetical protein n=1 Tax=Polaromonas sp. SM01 TaxID=3085630 RepID=UPI0029826A3B|nr:hypothetical protein [Polaromonas sp. SM01]